MVRQRLIVISLFILALPLWAQYNFDFHNTSNTVVVDTSLMEFFFRLENTGALPDSYELDCRVIDSVPNWFVQYCAFGTCVLPGTIRTGYLDVGESDSISIHVLVGPSSDSGMEVINMHVQSVFNPSLKDSINVYAVYGVPGQYGLEFSCLSDTIMIDTAMVEFQFRLENAGTSPDTYELDLRIIDEVPGWIESFFAGGVWANPGTALTDYLGVWAQDDEIYVRVDPTTQSVTEKLNLMVQSNADPNIKDSINIYVVANAPAVAENLETSLNKPILQLYPNPFTDKIDIRYLMTDVQMQEVRSKKQDLCLKIYDISGQLVKSFDLTAGLLPLTYVVSWDGTDESGLKLPTGVYFVHLVSPDIAITDKAILLR